MATAPYIVFPNSSFGEGALPLSRFLKLEIKPPVTDGLIFSCDLTRGQTPVNAVTGKALSVTGSPAQEDLGTIFTPYSNYIDTGVTPSINGTYFVITNTAIGSGRRLLVSSYDNDEDGVVTSGDSLAINTSDVEFHSVVKKDDAVSTSASSMDYTDNTTGFLAIYGMVKDTPQGYAGWLSGDGQLHYHRTDITGARDSSLLSETLLIGSNYSKTQKYGQKSQISCVLIYDRNLSADEITQVLSYLRLDWGQKVGLFS